MKQREITTPDHLTWTCVQAYAGMNSEAAEKASDLTESSNGQVPVVCTPSGGAQTVRLQLPKNWLEDFTDEQLQQAITGKQS